MDPKKNKVTPAVISWMIFFLRDLKKSLSEKIGPTPKVLNTVIGSFKIKFNPN
jgi:hypothetical protein